MLNWARPVGGISYHFHSSLLVYWSRLDAARPSRERREGTGDSRVERPGPGAGSAVLPCYCSEEKRRRGTAGVVA